MSDIDEVKNRLKDFEIPVSERLTKLKLIQKLIENTDEDTFKIVYDKKQLNQQHYKTFEVLASANVAKNTILKSFYTDGHKRTFKKENLNKVIEIIELNAKN